MQFVYSLIFFQINEFQLCEQVTITDTFEQTLRSHLQPEFYVSKVVTEV